MTRRNTFDDLLRSFAYSLDPDASSAGLATNHDGVWASSRAGPDITGLLLATAAAVCLPSDMAAIAGWQDLSAIDAGLNVVRLALSWYGEDASGEEGNGLDGKELHFEGFLLF